MNNLILGAAVLSLRMLGAVAVEAEANNNTYSNGTFAGTDDSVEGNDSSTASDTNSEDKYRSTHIAFGIAFAVLFVFVAIACSHGPDDDDSVEEGTPESQDEEEPSYAERVADMTIEERISLYSEAFEKNKNQIMLKSSHITVHDHSLERNENGERDDENPFSAEDEDDRSIYLALEGARAHRRSSLSMKQMSAVNAVIKDVNDTSPRRPLKRRSSSILHPSGTFDAMIHGNCIICFEDMEAGDIVVWSEAKSCPHVYHKDCMVGFLSHKRQTIKEIELDRNPCPTCRQKFITLIDTDDKKESPLPAPETLENNDGTSRLNPSSEVITTNDSDDIESNVTQSQQ